MTRESHDPTRDALYYERYKQRLVYVDDVDDETVLATNYHTDERVEYERDEFTRKLDDGDVQRVDSNSDAQLDDDVDEKVDEQLRLDELASQLAKYDRVVAKVETDKTYSPNLWVRARKGYGAPSNVMAILLDEFDADEFLSVIPTTVDSTLARGDESAAIEYRCSYGGR